MINKKTMRILMFSAFLALGAWIAFSAVGFSPEIASSQSGPLAFAPAGGAEKAAPGADRGQARPVVVNLRDIPAGLYDPNNQLDRWRRGEIQLERGDNIIDRTRIEDMRVESLNLPVSANITIGGSEPGTNAPAAAASGSFESIDYIECCGGGGSVPPDPELAVGPNHVIAVVNVALEIYDKNGTSLVGPTTFDSFMGSNSQCTGVFDPNANYDEQADRYILGIDADGSGYCIAVSQTGDPTGSWNIYYFATGSDFFDYPHAGVGEDAIYMGANMFRCRGPFNCSFAGARVWAFDKNAMYTGQSASFVSQSLGKSEDTPQPLNLHGFAQGTWPASGPHYFFSTTDYNGADYSVFAWDDPFGANNLSLVGTVDLNAATGVTAGMPVNVVQKTGGTLQGNDFRPQDFEYRNGFAWSVMTIACNPGSGTVNCVRWAKIDPASATVVDSGVYASNGEHRVFADLAVDACENMAVGYTKSSSSMYPGVYYTGRLDSDPAGTVQAESQLKAGEIEYTSFETSAPRRWGDYTEMTIDPAGTTFWYLGEYSKNTETPSGRWGTYIGSFTYNCGGTPPPSPTPGPSPTATTPPPPTATPDPTATPSATDIMYVSAIEMSYTLKGKNHDVRTTINIVSNGAPVANALVEIQVTLPGGGIATGSASTDNQGNVTFSVKSRDTGTYTSEVTNVSLAGYSYNSGSNVQTTQTLIVP